MIKTHGYLFEMFFTLKTLGTESELMGTLISPHENIISMKEQILLGWPILYIAWPRVDI